MQDIYVRDDKKKKKDTNDDQKPSMKPIKTQSTNNNDDNDDKKGPANLTNPHNNNNSNSNDNTNPTNNTNQTNPQPTNQSNQPQDRFSPPPRRNTWDNDYGMGGGYGSGWDDPWDYNKQSGSQNKRLTPEERVTMIEKVYQEVLGRKPDSKDISYYKYSTLSEDEIRKQLLEGKEHKELLENGREFKSMKERCESSEVRVKILEGQMRDQLEEFKKLGELLREKNRYIQFLRQKDNNPYGLPPKK